MIRLLTVIGARPQIIKAAAISRAVKNHFQGEIEEKILHTGQHYDANMSQIFFDELGIPQPDYNLRIGSGRHGEQTAKMIIGIEQTLHDGNFDGIILYGDTNSTLAGAIAASKTHTPIFHIEAGLRSFNMAMPEEVNRIVCDQLASICFSPTQTGIDNLQREGLLESKEKFKNGKSRNIVYSGDVMYDNIIYFASLAEQKRDILKRYDLVSNQYILSTIHRDNNTDSQERLTSIFSALLDIAEKDNIKTILPLHPRTAKLLPHNLEKQTYKKLQESKLVQIIPPTSFLEIINLEKNAKIVITDSGGIQKEAFFLEKPCIILRSETEWVEIVNHEAGIIADADKTRIIDSYEKLANHPVSFPKLFGNANAAKLILETIKNYYLQAW